MCPQNWLGYVQTEDPFSLRFVTFVQRLTKIDKKCQICTNVAMQKAFDREYVKSVCFVIPDQLSAETNEFEKSKLFTAGCNKDAIKISNGNEKSNVVAAMINTWAGPCLIRKEIFSPQWLAKVKRLRVSIKAAVDTTFKAEGLIRCSLSWQYKTNSVFCVAPKLPFKIIFETGLINEKITKIETNRRQTVRWSDHVVTIAESLENKAAV